MRFDPLTQSIGAMVHDLDLRAPFTESGKIQLRAALAEHEVLFFRNQKLTPANHLALAHAFGEPVPHSAYPHVEGHPEIAILENDPSEAPKIDTWHTDMTFLEQPPMGSILHAVLIPPSGGDTMWASLSEAYATLSPSMQEFLESKRAVHSFAHGFRHSLAEPGGRERLEVMVRDNPPRDHPVVRTHPDSGKKVLFVNPLFTTHIVGLRDTESRAVLDFLFAHIVTPELTCRFRWEVDSVALWDNRATVHRPVNDYWPGHRRMQRITIAGDRPN